MKKIGIITHYLNNINYGGVLQAYALCCILDKMGFEAEQISFDMTSSDKKTKMEKIRELDFFSFIQKAFFYPFRKLCILYKKCALNKYKKKIIERKRLITAFGNKIKHTEKIYNRNDIDSVCDSYDVFITGSDQVWNLRWYYEAFFLTFVSSAKKKISYAASIGNSELTSQQLTTFKNNLRGFSAISVREKDAVELLKEVAPVPVVWTLDPTLLLSKQEWNKVCTDRIVIEDYVFCYFLGSDKKQRLLATEYAKKHNLKLVNIPFMHNIYDKVDENFGDIQLFDIGSEKLLSLIKYAKFVFTDSFHATVFSGIYEKQYIVFQREGHKGMGSRIYSLTELFETEDRFCDSAKKESLSYIEDLSEIDYNKELKMLSLKKKESIDFLLNALS